MLTEACVTIERPNRKRDGRLLALCAVVLVGCDFPGQPNAGQRPAPADEIRQF